MNSDTMTDEERKQALRSAASFKLSLTQALQVDRRIGAVAFRVATVLLQFMNPATGEIRPTRKTLAEIVGVSERTIYLSLIDLREAKWLKWTRKNRQSANVYTFDDANVEEMVKRWGEIAYGPKKPQPARSKHASDVNGSFCQKHEETSPTETVVPVPTGTVVPPYNLEVSPIKRAAS